MPKSESEASETVWSAERLNVKEQQVQKDEANRYETASLSRLKRLAEVLGLE